MSAEVTEDAALGGRLRLKQPRRGHRVGHDAILLAAACPARAGERVVDLGAGVGAAGLALALRVAGIEVALVEVDAGLARLAAQNAQINGLATRVTSAVLDVAAPTRAFAAAGLGPGSVARVLMNPPFNDPARQRASPDRRRARQRARHGRDGADDRGRLFDPARQRASPGCGRRRQAARPSCCCRASCSTTVRDARLRKPNRCCAPARPCR